MTTQEYLDLRNEASIRGVASSTVANAPVALTEEAVERIVEAFCVWLISRTGKTKVRVAVGHDSRPSSPALYQAALQGITKTGHDALAFARSTLNTLLSITQSEPQTDGAQRYGEIHGTVYITARALGEEYNGLEFFYRDGVLSTDDVREILQIAADYRFAEPNVLGTVTNYNARFKEEYSFHLTLQEKNGNHDLGKCLISAYETYASGLYFTSPVQNNGIGFLLSYDDLHGDGSVLLRAGTQDNLLSVSVESNRIDGGIKMVKDLYYFLKKYPQVDVTPLEESIYAWREAKTLALKEKFTNRKLVRVQF